MPWQTTDLVEYVEAEPPRYEIRWECQHCRGRFGMEVPEVAAREALGRRARHVVVRQVNPEQHAGGPTICDDDEIDFALAWLPGQDETEDAVWDRVWEELIGDTESEEVRE
jgi:hypothetical protein